MQIIASEILTDLSSLSLGLILSLLPVGAALWLLGWWIHRFWIVLGATVTAGVIGLNEATQWRAQPIIVAILLAIAAGVLALALVRLVAFIASGIVGMALVQTIAPSLSQPAIVFLLTGLLGLFLFRWCFMGLTSFLGSVLLGYAVLALVHYYEKGDAVRWSDNNYLLLNSICWGLTLGGFFFQIFLHRWQHRKRKKADDDEDEDERDERGGSVATILTVFGWGGRRAA